jgi:hypothetical protein
VNLETNTHWDVNNSDTDTAEFQDNNASIVVDIVYEDVSEIPVVGGL